MKKLYFFLIYSLFFVSGLYAGETDYTQGLSIWFDTPNTLQGYAVWYGVIIRILLGNRNHYR